MEGLLSWPLLWSLFPRKEIGSRVSRQWVLTARTCGSDSWAPHHAAWLSLILLCSLIPWADWIWENYESAEELWLILRPLQLFHCFLLQVSSQGRAREVIREGSPVLLAWGPCVWGLGCGGAPTDHWAEVWWQSLLRSATQQERGFPLSWDPQPT